MTHHADQYDGRGCPACEDDEHCAEHCDCTECQLRRAVERLTEERDRLRVDVGLGVQLNGDLRAELACAETTKETLGALVDKTRKERDALRAERDSLLISRDDAVAMEDRARNERDAAVRERDAWRASAQAAGERLASIGPVGYYTMGPASWCAWAVEATMRLLAIEEAVSELAKHWREIPSEVLHVYDAIAQIEAALRGQKPGEAK